MALIVDLGVWVDLARATLFQASPGVFLPQADPSIPLQECTPVTGHGERETRGV